VKVFFYSLVFVLLSVGGAFAADQEYVLTIKDHKFTPEVLKIPANKKVKITVDNQDATPEEFESHDLSREKVIPANTKGKVVIGPLKAGTYKYVGEFHEDSAHGTIVAE
jgi:hypothetical protein